MADISKAKAVRLHWDEEQCTGCTSCVVVCSERHTGTSAPSRARLQVLVDPLSADRTARYCRQCDNALCAAACPEEAILFDAALRAWIVLPARCTACGACVEACRFEAMRLDPIDDLAIKCDLCLGAARCVEICPSGALSLRGVAREVEDEA